VRGDSLKTELPAILKIQTGFELKKNKRTKILHTNGLVLIGIAPDVFLLSHFLVYNWLNSSNKFYAITGGGFSIYPLISQ
jgi:hypothetical protein